MKITDKLKHIYVIQCLVDNKINFLPIKLDFILCDDEGDWIDDYKEIVKRELIKQYYGLYKDNTDVISIVYYHCVNENGMEV